MVSDDKVIVATPEAYVAEVPTETPLAVKWMSCPDVLLTGLVWNPAVRVMGW